MNKKSFRHRRGSIPTMLKIPVASLMGVGIISLSACQESSLDNPVESAGGDVVVVKLPQFNASSSSTGETNVSVELFQFTNQLLKKKLIVDGSQEDPVVLDKESSTKVFAVYGYSIDAIEGKTDEESFSLTKISSEGMSSAPIFFSSVEELDPEANSLNVSMTRGVARIDINNAKENLQIETLTVENAAAESYVFPVEGSVCESATLTYSCNFDGLQGLKKGVVTLFESANPVTVTLTGLADGEPVEITMQTPAIKRNKVYTVSLASDTPVNPDDPGQTTTVKSTITVADWEDGDDYSPAPDATNGIKLDVEASAFPENVTYDEATATIDVPADGFDDFKIVFRSDLRIDIDNFTLNGDWVEKDSLVSRGAFSINNYKVTESGDDILTTYSLKILPQLVARSEYVIDLGVRKASMANVYDHVKIRVAQHPDQVHTVNIAGHEWMCFNATSNNIEEQIFPIRGTSVDEMYNEHFFDCLGMYFQYGKENPFSPWTSNDPAQFAEQTRDIPWKSVDRMPLPEGYHVPSLTEWKDLIPHNTTIPASYMTPSGDSIKATVVTLPGTLVTPSEAANARNFKMRYVLFESITTGAKLYLPIMGLKSNTKDEVPGMRGYNYDVRTSYWAAEERYIWLIDYKTLDGGVEGALLQQNRWNADGFLPVRGIKD
ncbi:MAG: hypothetical protein HDR88_14060 [Bacteroides sp.]|nr:hypothetical protein [Bacteroides sp.]